MNTEAEINLLRDRVRELEKTIERYEKNPAAMLPWWRRAALSAGIAIVVFGSAFTLRQEIGPAFGFEPSRSTAYRLETESIVFEDFDAEDRRDKFRGKIRGDTAEIDISGEDGRIRISPKGIHLEGPDGEVVIKPTKPD